MVYLDNNATTPLDPAAQEKMSQFLREHYGNPSSLYPIGRAVKEIITEAREVIAKALGAIRTEIFFTGSGSEADNFAIRGILEAFPEKNEFITSTIEHPAVIETARYLEKKGIKVSFVPVDQYGTIDLDFLKKAITPKTFLISIMHANNEIGTIQPIEAVTKIASKKECWFTLMLFRPLVRLMWMSKNWAWISSLFLLTRSMDRKELVPFMSGKAQISNLLYTGDIKREK